MWQLTPPSDELKTYYTKTMLDPLVDRIRKHTDRWIQDILLPDEKYQELKTLLTGTPEQLFRLNRQLMAAIRQQSEADYERDLKRYIQIKRKCPEEEKDFCTAFQQLLDQLGKAFDYTGQISNNKALSYKLTSEQGHNTCTYCNRQYIFTIASDNGQTKLVRPHLDHWFAKAYYPLLSLSLQNLIPCCPVCNSSIKGDEIFSLKTHVHPYLQQHAPRFRFAAYPETAGQWGVRIEEPDDKKERNTLKSLHLEEVYACHAGLEVKDLLQWRLQYGDDYLNWLTESMQEHFRISREETYRMLFGTEAAADKALDRPLSKLKRDILEQLGGIESTKLSSK
ncbi:MAG: hypothetical protein IJ169_06200 [Paludibacteraceae bacterium]|nr:hypothetical protein [Paludibacteraceae bacterium]